MFRRLSAFAALCVSSLLVSCSDNGNALGPNGVKLKSKIIVRVQDANTRQPIANAVVTVMGGPEGKTDKDGEVDFTDVPSGTYYVRTASDGYETGEEAMDAAVKGELTPVPVLVSRVISLYKKGAVVRGRIMVRPNKTKEPMRSSGAVDVELRLSGSFANTLRTARTNAAGEFSFDSLPELSSYSLRVPEFTLDDKRYRLTSGGGLSVSLASDEQYDMPLTVLDPVTTGTLQIVSLSLLKLEKGNAMQVEFTSGVDTASLVTGSVLLQAAFQTIAAQLSWNGDFTVLSVKPYQADWSNGVTYTLTLSSIYDLRGNPLRGPSGETSVSVTGSLNTPDGNPDKVVNLRLRNNLYIPSLGSYVDTNVADFLTSSYRLLWSKSEGAFGYDVYTKDGVDSVWRLTASSVTDTQTTLSLSTPRMEKGPLRQHMVVARGEKIPAGFDGAATLVVNDGVKPTLSLSSPLSLTLGGSFDNTAGSVKRTLELTVSLRAWSSSTSEPLDSTKVPQIRVAEGCNFLGGCDSAYSARVPGWVWTSRTAGKLKIEVDPGKDGRRDTLIIDFSKVTDLGGNAFDTVPAPPVLRYLTQY